MKTGRILFIAVLLMAGVVIYLNKCQNDPASNKTQGKGSSQPLLVNGIIVNRQNIENKIFASGTLMANEEVEIRNEMPGRITSILFKEGSRVKKGDLLLTLYDDDLQAQLKKLQLEKEIAKKTEERQRDLLEIKGVSQQDYDIALNQLNTLNADIELLQTTISKTKIVSPFDGIIGLKTVSTGAFLPVNTRIATIQETDPIKLEFSLPERYSEMVNTNSEIHFTTESVEGLFSGKIYAFEPKIDLQTRTILVRAFCPNKDSKLLPGAFAHIEVALKKVEDAILIPTQALVPELKGQKVFVAREGKAEKVAVETGIRNDSAIQIISGINEGDTVLVTGIMQMRPGMPLQVNIRNNTNSGK